MSQDGFLQGVRVLEFADETAEACGRILAGLGAEVIKVEAPSGEPTRSYGPFVDDVRDVEASLYHWHFNQGKRSVVLDLGTPHDVDRLRDLMRRVDVVVESRPKGYFSGLGLESTAIRRDNPRLIWARVTPFGDDGPWSHFVGSDLVHLALGGVMMNCGYDPEPSGEYDLPPVAAQMWQSYQITGDMMSMSVVTALIERHQSGLGQDLSTSVHRSVAQQTETDVPNWIYSRRKHFRKTARHSNPNVGQGSAIAMTKDGRWTLPYRTYLGGGATEFDDLIGVLARHGMEEDLGDARYRDPDFRNDPEVSQHIFDVMARFVNAFRFDRDVWKWFQEVGSTWAPVRRPEENAADEHWLARQTFADVYHGKLGRPVTEVGGRWYCAEVPWKGADTAPSIGQHSQEILTTNLRAPQELSSAFGRSEPDSAMGRATALDGVRVLDLGWLLASAGAGRFLGAHGAEVIKVEHHSRPDRMRFANGFPPPGGRRERDRMSGPVARDQGPAPVPGGPNQSGFFMDINASKLAISLNLKKREGLGLLRRLLERSNALSEGFSPGTMARMGLDYEELRSLRPDIVYVQQSGMGVHGTYGRMRSYGPVAQGFSGLTDMSGFPDPYPPAGIGYSYLDWFGAYNLAMALLAGLYRQATTGEGCHIDSSQVEIGIYLTGTAVLDHAVNGRRWTRYGNGSPYKPAMPHGVFRVHGDDRWVAIACFDDEQWCALVDVLSLNDPEVALRELTLPERIASQDLVQSHVARAVRDMDPFELMHALQVVGVPAGVCQTAEDRYERDPQLKHDGWLVELNQTEIGRWPVKNLPVDFSRTHHHIGGVLDRHGPNYGEDNEYVFGEILGLGRSEIERLIDADII